MLKEVNARAGLSKYRFESETQMAKQRKIDTSPWLGGIIFSLVLLAIFLVLQANDSNILALDVKWLVVASIPLLIALLSSNIIQKFKGFGFELETRLQKPISTIGLTARDALSEMPSDEKGSFERLRRLSKVERAKIQRLVFRMGHANRYSIEAIKEYLISLHNLRYVEVVDQDGKFVALLPARVFRKGKDIDISAVDNFLSALFTNSITSHFKGTAITQAISENLNLLDALQQIRKSGEGLLPVITDDGKILGVATLGAVESKIADEVLSAQAEA
jgi:hypothetical protein